MSDQSKPKQKKVPSTHWEQLHTLCANPSGQRLAASGPRPDELPPQLTLWDASSGKVEVEIPDLASPIETLLFADDDTLLSGDTNGSLQLWNLKGKKPSCKTTVEAHEGPIHALALSQDGKTLYSAGQDSTLRAWSFPALKAQDVTFAWPEETPIHALLADPQESWIAAAGQDGNIRLFDHKSGECTREMEGHHGPVYAMLMHPNEYRIISTGDDRSIRLWFLKGEVEFEDRAEKTSHDTAIRHMALTPVHKDDEGEDVPARLVTGSDDGSIKIWQLHSKRKPKTLTEHSGACSGLVTLPHEQGTQLFASSHNRTICGWLLNTQSEPLGTNFLIEDAFHQLEAQLSHKKVELREKAVAAFADVLRDPEVFQLLLDHLHVDDAEQIRKQIVQTLATSTHRKPIKELREALNDRHGTVRKAALEALRTLQGETSLAPLESALQANNSDVRILAIKILTELQKTSPRAQSLILQSLNDRSYEVQIAALNALETIYPSTPKRPDPQPLLLALRQDQLRLQMEAIRRIHRYKWAFLPELQTVLIRTLEHHDESLRQLTFEVMIAAVDPLAVALYQRDENIDRALQELEEREKEKPKEKDEEDKKEKKKFKSRVKKKPDAVELSDEELQPLLLGLTSQHPDISLQAACAMARLQDLRAFGTLLQLSQEHDAAHRKDTAIAFRSLGDSRALPYLEAIMRDSHKDVRDAAFDSYLAISDDPILTAQAGLKSPHADIRNRALQRLVPEKGKSATPEGLALLKQTLNDKEANVHNEAFKILWNLYPKNPEECLIPTMQSHQTSLRKKGIDESIAFKAQDWVGETLRGLLDENDTAVRDHAYKALQTIAPSRSPEAHIAALQSTHAALRRQAIQKLSSYKRDAIRDALLTSLNDEDQQVRQSALQTLLKSFAKDSDLLAQTLQIPHSDIRLQTALHLARLGDSRALEVSTAYIQAEQALIQTLLAPQEGERPDLSKLPAKERNELRESRHTIIHIISTLGDPQGIETLTTFLDDDDHNTAQKALEGICACATSEHIALLQEQSKHTNALRREAAAEGLARLGDTSALHLLEDFLNASDTHEKRRAIAGFHAAQPNFSSRLLGLLDTHSRDARQDALSLVFAHELHHATQGDPPSLLLQMLNDSHDEIRLEAAWATECRPDRDAFLSHLTARLCANIPEGSNKNDQKLHKETVESIPTLIAALHDEDPILRYEAAWLLLTRDEPAAYQERWERRLRHLKLPKPPKPSKKDNAPASPQLEQIAFGAYVGMVRNANINTSTRTQALKRLAALGQSEHFSNAALLPALRHALNDSDYAEVRKTAFGAIQSLYPEGDLTPYHFALETDHADNGLQTLNALATMEGEAARDLVAEALNSDVREVRRKAAETLQTFYDEDSLEPFILALSSEHSDVRLRVVDRLLDSQDARVTTALTQALRSDHDDLRLKAAEALARRKEASTFDVLAEFLSREENHLQQRAAQAMLQLGDPRTLDAFVQRIEDDPEQSADSSMLVESIGQLGNPDAAPWLLTQLETGSSYQRSRAYNALLGLAGPPKKRDTNLYLSLLTQVLDTKQDSLRQEAIDQLELLEHDDVQNILKGLLNDRNEDLRRRAFQAIVARIPERDADTEVLVEGLQHNDSVIRLKAAIKLAQDKHPEAYPILLIAFQTSIDGYNQQYAVDALGVLGDPRALDYLLPLLDPEAEYHPARDAAAEAVGRIAPAKRKNEIKELLQQLLQHSSSELRSRALIGLRYLMGPDALSLLVNVIKQNSDWGGWYIRQTAARQLGELGDPEAEAILTKLMEDSDSDVRETAFEALKKIFGEEAPKPHLLRFDSAQTSYYDRQKSAAVLAKVAEPSEILLRLPLPPFAQEQSDNDPFVEASNRSLGEEADDDGPREADAESRRLLERGLLDREPSPVDGLREALKHPKPKVQLNAAALLVQLNITDAADDLHQSAKALAKVEAHTRQSQQLWRTLLWALSVLSPSHAAKASLDALGNAHASAEVQAQAAANLGYAKSNTKKATAALQEALAHPTEKVRRHAAWALANTLKDAAALESLPRLPGASHHLSQHAAELAPASLWTHAAMRDIWPSLIAQKQSALFSSMLEDPDAPDSIAPSAIDALGQIADEAAIQTLDTLRQNDDQPKPLRAAAYRAWRRALRTVQRAQAHAN